MRSKQLVSVLLWLCLAALVLTVPDMSVSPVDADQLEKEMSDFYAAAYQRELSELKSLRDAEEGITGGQTNGYACTGGQDPSKMSYKDYLNAFAAGPCTPVIFLAGITGTKMQAVIDCPTLQAQNPQLFSDCKWTTCKKSTFNIGVPKDEYTVWMPDVLSPMNIANPTNANKKCFTGLFGMKWTKDSSGKLVPVQNPGVKVVPMGFSPGTRTNSKCGFDAICDILPVAAFLSPALYKVFEKFRINLEGMGYRIGLNLQAMPYDWRRPYYDNEVFHEFTKILEEMVSINGKRVSIVAHSMGNVNMANQMKRLTTEQRARLVKRYFAVAPPYLGSALTWSMAIGSAGGYNDGFVGMDFYTFSRTSPTFPSVFDLMPRDSWNLYRNTTWIKSIENRIAIEANKKPTHDIPADKDIFAKIYPSVKDTCYDKVYGLKANTLCYTGIREFSFFGNILDLKVTSETIGESLERFSYNPVAKTIFDAEDIRPDYDRLDNPGVETVIIYSGLANTEKEFEWDYDPTTITKAENPNFAEPTETKYELGDGSVILAASLAAGMKWAYEFDQQDNPDAKPIIFAELCSVKNPKSSVYQSPFTVSKNEYQSIACDCPADDTKSCNHVGIVSENNVINYVSNSLLDNQAADPNRKFNNWSDAEIASYVKNCNLLIQSDSSSENVEAETI
jgi:hypothetical protein